MMDENAEVVVEKIKLDNRKIGDEKIKLVDDFLFKNFDDKNFVHKKTKTDKVALLLDPRCHYRFRPIIVNHLKCMKDWNLYVIGTTECINYVKLILPNVEFDYTVINEKNLNPFQVTDILLQEKLYVEQLQPYEHIYTFQVDSLIFKPFDDRIFKRSYVGALDYMTNTEESFLKVYNGGSSYRKKSFMLECIRNFDHDTISRKREELGFLVVNRYCEDFYLSMCLTLMEQGTLQDVEYHDECKLFLQNNIESDKEILDNAMALHAFDRHTRRFISFVDLKYLIENCKIF